jgi:SAM-dependent methyltransferase
VPTIEQNRKAWDIDYCWPEDGDEWSRSWGGAEAQWFETLLPRIHPFLPTGTILEIAPGRGRWTQFLKDYCSGIVVVDLGAHCIEACRQRFSACSHITYHVNDGRSLGMLPDRSVDFAFSFDSLVHAEADVIEAYLNDLGRKLTPNGVGFIHHSHIGAYRRAYSFINRVPRRLRSRLERHGWLPRDHWRAHSMTAQRFEAFCVGAGLACIGQELVNWEGRILLDAFSMFTVSDSVWTRPNRVFKNDRFMQTTHDGRRLAQHYARSSYPRATGRRYPTLPRLVDEAGTRSDGLLAAAGPSHSGVTAVPSVHDV